MSPPLICLSADDDLIFELVEDKSSLKFQISSAVLNILYFIGDDKIDDDLSSFSSLPPSLLPLGNTAYSIRSSSEGGAEQPLKQTGCCRIGDLIECCSVASFSMVGEMMVRSSFPVQDYTVRLN